jgi:hypothetical protein
MLQNFSQFLDHLPLTQSDKVTDKYMFLDTRRVIDDMADLGFMVAATRWPKSRTKDGPFGLHEVDFRRPDAPTIGDSVPRILFHNSYDGSRKAQFSYGIFRLVCDNGLVVGNAQTFKFLHLGDYLDDLLNQIRAMAETQGQVFDRINDFQSITLDPDQYYHMAEEAALLRFPDPETRPEIDPKNLLQVRRDADLGKDLWTRFNVVQENLLRGGVPIVNQKGQARLAPPVGNIERSNELNRGLWDLAERYAEAA